LLNVYRTTNKLLKAGFTRIWVHISKGDFSFLRTSKFLTKSIS